MTREKLLHDDADSGLLFYSKVDSPQFNKQYMPTDIDYHEISTSNRKILSSILSFLESHFPQSFYLWQLLSNVATNKISDKHLWPHRLFINDFDEIRCVLFIYSTVGFQSDYSLKQGEGSFTQMYATFFSLRETDHIILSIIKKHIPWFNCKNICFFANDHQSSSMIMKLIDENKFGSFKPSSFYMLELDKDQFERNQQQNLPTLPSDIIIRRLTAADAETVNNAWTYRSATSLARITYEIENFPAFGALRNERLVSWCLTKFDGSIGTVQTNPDARRLGLASTLMTRVASELFKTQDHRIICFVHLNNVASLGMVEKLGYRRSCIIDWIPQES